MYVMPVYQKNSLSKLCQTVAIGCWNIECMNRFVFTIQSVSEWKFWFVYTTYIPSQSWEQTQVSCINLNSLCLPATQYIRSHLLVATSHVVFISFLSRSWKHTLILQWQRSMALSTCWDYSVSSSHLSAYTVSVWSGNLTYIWGRRSAFKLMHTDGSHSFQSALCC